MDHGIISVEIFELYQKVDIRMGSAAQYNDWAISEIQFKYEKLKFFD